MRLQPICCGVALLIAVPFWAVIGRSQTTASGALSGVVTDQTNAVVPDAVVEIADIAKATTQSAKSDGKGVYQFSFLRPGRYTLKTTHPGFREAKQWVIVQVGPPTTVNLSLRVAENSTEIIVFDQAPTIRAQSGDVSEAINQKQISEVPNPGNDLTYIAQTAPAP